MAQEKLRWQYRFETYSSVLSLLRRIVELNQTKGFPDFPEDLPDIVKESLVHRFELTLELAWKTLKDYLESEGIKITSATPRDVIVEAIAANIITRREDWMAALDDRNTISHVYSRAAYEQVVKNIEQNHLSLLEQFHKRLLGEADQTKRMKRADPNDHGLSDRDLRIIAGVLADYRQKIDEVGLFGSRACGQHKDYSDVDLVLYGDLEEREVARIYTLFKESSLGLKVDVHAYHHIEYAPLKERVDDTAKTLFTREQITTHENGVRE